jgi:hypothetical protein
MKNFTFGPCLRSLMHQAGQRRLAQSSHSWLPSRKGSVGPVAVDCTYDQIRSSAERSPVHSRGCAGDMGNLTWPGGDARTEVDKELAPR